jgi:hypothetical protein
MYFRMLTTRKLYSYYGVIGSLILVWLAHRDEGTTNQTNINTALHQKSFWYSL